MPFLTAKNLKRYGEIGRILFKYFNPEIVKDFSSGLNIPFVEEKKESRSAGDLAKDLQNLGPTFIKLGQVLSTQSELLPVSYEEELSKLQDKAEPFPYEDVEEIFSSEFGIKINKAFREFDPRPVAAASISQVHRAVLHSGKLVAVKVQRPHLEETIFQDLEILEEITDFLDKHSRWGKHTRFSEKFDEFKMTLLNELNFKKEAINLLTLRENLKEYNNVIIPAPIEDYTSKKVLTMDFIDATNINRLSPVVKLDFDTEKLTSDLFSAYLKQILIDGLWHMDPHPGNVYLTQNGKIALLDLGMVASIPPELRKILLKLLFAISEGKGEDVAELVARSGRKGENFDLRSLTIKVSKLVSEVQRVTLEDLTFSRILMQINRIAFESDILLPSQFGALAKTILHLEQVGKSLNPKFDPFAAIKKNTEELMNRHIQKELTVTSVAQVFLEEADLLRQLPSKLINLLDLASHNELKVKLETLDEKKLMRGFQKIANRITFGLILASLIIGGALLMQSNRDLTLIMLGLASFGGIFLFLYVYFKDEL